MKNDGKCGSRDPPKVRNQFDWWSAFGDGPVGTRNVIKRLSEGKRLSKLSRLVYLKVKKDYSRGSTIDRSRSAIVGLGHQATRVDHQAKRPDHSRGEQHQDYVVDNDNGN